MPDPGEDTDLAEFISSLGELRAWAGMPSYRTLAKRVGPLIRPARVVSLSTVVDVFKAGWRRLDLDLVVAIVRALGLDEPAVGRWRQACIQVHGHAKTDAPVGVFAQLPTDLATFTGRREEIVRLVAAATHSRDVDGVGANAVVVSSIESMAGVGKTQLAIHAATNCSAPACSPRPSCMSTCVASTPNTLLPTRPRFWRLFCGSWAWPRSRSPQRETSGRLCTATGCGSAARWSCWTTPPMRTRSETSSLPARAAWS